jgi:hypothetical protein
MKKYRNYKKEHELLRKKLWIKVAVAYTGASNSTSTTNMSDWADHALKEFDKRFKQE